MSDGMRNLRRFGGSGLALATILAGALVILQRPVRSATDFSGFGAVGSFFGKAIQLCPVGTAPAACSSAGPALALWMTPTMTSDGIFLGDDSFALGSAPFGPHTGAHGQWFPTSKTEFTADYTFMLNTFPPVKDTISITGLRFRWAGIVADKNTLQGWVNLYFNQGMVPVWSELLNDQFPVLPPEADGVVTPPTGFVKDPSLCKTSGCPLVFKFTVKRIAPVLQ